MGLIELFAGRFSLGAAAAVLVGSYILYKVCLRIDEETRIRRLGVRAQKISHQYLFGLDFIRRSVKAVTEHKMLDMWRQNFASLGGFTGETRIMGQRVLLTADPENIKAILATQFGDYGKGEPFRREWKAFLGDSIFVTDGDKWHASRQLLRPQFIRDRISDLHMFESHLQTLFRAMANGGPLEHADQRVDMAAVNGKVFDISDLFFRYSLDVATDFLLGKDVESLTNPREPFADAFNETQRMQSLMMRAGPLRPLLSRRSYYEGLKVVNEFIHLYVDRALQLSPEELATRTKSDQGYTFLHELALFTRDREVIRDQIVGVLLAGRDTTAATLSWTVYELGRHPDAVRRLRAEIADVVGRERTPTYADLKGMKYLQNVMSEILRLYPSVPFNVRLALRDTTLPRGGGPDGGQPVAVLKNTPVSYSTLVMQRRSDLHPPASADFPDVETFAPERWYHWQPRPWQYIPFNGGPRICIGQQFALTEMAYVLVRLFQRFERVQSFMHEVDGGSPRLKADIVLQPADGVRVAFWEAAKPKSG